MADSPSVRDLFARPLRDLRVSVTDRCNFRCRYCMPREVFGPGFEFMRTVDLLTIDEIVEVVEAAARLGVQKVRLTGGEPLLRRDITLLVGRLRRIGSLDLAMTTNGVGLTRHAAALAEAGLSRLTVSLDSLDDERFRLMSDTRAGVADVLDGIAAAERAGFTSLKINAVIRADHPDSDILDLADYFRGTGHVLRFIEYMDVGSTNGWRADQVKNADHIAGLIGRHHPLRSLEPNYPGEVARRYQYRDGAGEIGIISSVSKPFCTDCTRARLAADGKLYTCLFATEGTDLRALLRGTRAPGDLERALGGRWRRRDDEYSQTRQDETLPTSSRRIEMSYIGG
ncbi:GTP 3',8-cyclase MoaA [Streptomyces sp. NBC_01803]|uniref:GTP 3',8-cyclase MoaA n=1 Tax=Streptomyces sp. NBC_01803 TaxID=2975946 RepID=UPI002DDA970C|nr:GTP 3',8-cyclase MoaA [Streptomyces sp. NBC_01803]WSA42959.1 GTP 3',8-cyclase MoaA [Streptomyces sp. NBC_01803]